MTDIDIFSLLANWLNDIKYDESRIIPTIIGYNLIKWLISKGIIKDNIPEELLKSPDIKEALEKDANNYSKLMKAFGECCQEIVNNNKYGNSY